MPGGRHDYMMPWNPAAIRILLAAYKRTNNYQATTNAVRKKGFPYTVAACKAKLDRLSKASSDGIYLCSVCGKSKKGHTCVGRTNKAGGRRHRMNAGSGPSRRPRATQREKSTHTNKEQLDNEPWPHQDECDDAEQVADQGECVAALHNHFKSLSTADALGDFLHEAGVGPAAMGFCTRPQHGVEALDLQPAARQICVPPRLPAAVPPPATPATLLRAMNQIIREDSMSGNSRGTRLRILCALVAHAEELAHAAH